MTLDDLKELRLTLRDLLDQIDEMETEESPEEFNDAIHNQINEEIQELYNAATDLDRSFRVLAIQFPELKP